MLRNSFSRVAERAAFPAVLFTIHFGGFRKIVCTATPMPATTRVRISCSISDSVREKFFALHFRHDHDVFGPEIGIVHAHRDHAAVVNRGMAGDNLLDVLGIDVFAADDQQVFLAPDDVEFAVTA